MSTLPCFTNDEKSRAHRLLALKVAHMMGRKLEEADWDEVYCGAKGIPVQGWSNLNIDIMHNGLGVEHKMLCITSRKNLEDVCGTTQMHPSLTRSIRIPDNNADPDEVMADVLTQYGDLVASRSQKVADNASIPVDMADMRTGWLLWQASLKQFLYFEERMSTPNPEDYRAKWNETAGGTRKSSKSLWIFEKSTGRKRYSVTTSAGIKIQPYFDVPPPTDPNLFLVTVIGEHVEDGRIRVWLTRKTAQALKGLIGNLDFETLSRYVESAAKSMETEPSTEVANNQLDEIVPVLLTPGAYKALIGAAPGINDENSFQLLIDHMVQ